MNKRIVAFFLLIVVFVGLLIFSQWRHALVTASGTIEADEIRVGSLVGGRVDKVLVAEGDAVEPGTLLVTLDAYDLKERQAEAAANLASAQAELSRLEEGFRKEEIAQARAQVAQLSAHLKMLIAGPRAQEIAAADARLDAAKSELKLAQQNYDREKKVFESGASTQEKMDTATDQLHNAKAMLNVRTQELDLLKAGTREEELAEAEAKTNEAEQVLKLRESGYRPQDVEQARAAVAAAKASLDAINRQLAETEVRSPVTGRVDALDLRPGDLVSPRAPVLSLLDFHRLWIRTYVPINVRGIQVGQKIPVRVDALPNEQFEGEVMFISSDPEFTPSNTQTPEDRAKQVFRVKVLLPGTQGKLRPGMAGVIVLPE